MKQERCGRLGKKLDGNAVDFRLLPHTREEDVQRVVCHLHLKRNNTRLSETKVAEDVKVRQERLALDDDVKHALACRMVGEQG